MNREEVQKLAQEKLKHCVCHLKIQCPCNYFRQYDICKCAGEECDHNEWIKINEQ